MLQARIVNRNCSDLPFSDVQHLNPFHQHLAARTMKSSSARSEKFPVNMGLSPTDRLCYDNAHEREQRKRPARTPCDSTRARAGNWLPLLRCRTCPDAWPAWLCPQPKRRQRRSSRTGIAFRSRTTTRTAAPRATGCRRQQGRNNMARTNRTFQRISRSLVIETTDKPTSRRGHRT
jgi:hypothetical protein